MSAPRPPHPPAPRPARSRLRAALVAALVLAAGARAVAPAAAQTPLRAMPESVELGRLSIGVFPEAMLDGRPVRLGPGTRIYDESNLVRPPSTVTGERRVAYARGAMGEINRVWLITDAEHREISARIAAARRAATQR